MNSKHSIVAVLTYLSFLLQYHVVHSGVLEISTDNCTDHQLITSLGLRSVRENIPAGKDNDLQGEWRKDFGDLVQLNRIKKEQLKTVPVDKSGSNLLGSGDIMQTPLDIESTSTLPSRRQKRTFWPFTSIFGYDYYPPPPVFSPMMPPFGGIGYGPMGPPPPPPFGFGLGFGFGR